MKSYIIILLFAIFSLSSCSLEEDDNYTNVVPVVLPIENAEVPLEFEFGESYSIVVNYSFPDNCHGFNDIYYEYEGNNRIIAIMAFKNDDGLCTQSLIEKEHTFIVKCTQTETYVFKFWQGKNSQDEDQYLILEVPVIN